MDRSRPFRILSIDGGGVRGIIPARFLKALEEMSQQPIHTLFDLIVGTSTGGLIALGLTCPHQQHQGPKYRAQDIVDFYLKESASIFKHSLLRNMRTGVGLWGAKYDRKPFDAILEIFFGEARLSEALSKVVLPTYSLIEKTPHLFSSIEARDTKIDYWMRDIAGATSAAPTYFDPKIFQDNQGKQSIDIDGGIFANNPESIAVMEAYKQQPNLERKDIFLISMGTGSIQFNRRSDQLSNAGVIGWVMRANLIDLMMSADSDWYNDEISAIYPNASRLQVSLPENLGAMDDATPQALQGLLDLAEAFVHTHTMQLQNLVTVLCGSPTK